MNVPQRILAALEDGPSTARDLTDRLDSTFETVRNALRLLRGSGKIVLCGGSGLRNDPRVWALVGAGVAAAITPLAAAGERWTPARVETLAKLWAQGRSCSQIAKALGCGFTRSAIIGKVHRLGLSRRGRMAPSAPTRTVTPPRERLTRPRALRPPMPAPTQPRPYRPNVVSLTEPAALLVPILDLRPSHCRWPVAGESADMLFCGHPRADGSAYCPHHRARSVSPQTPKKLGELVRDLRRYA